MPVAFERALPAGLSTFVVMQVCGVAAFILAANVSSRVVGRYGAERVISAGTAASSAGALALLVYALLGGVQTVELVTLWVIVNLGFGLRGPPGFFQAVLAAQGDDARGSAVVVLGFLAVAAAGTVMAAPFLEHGIAPLAATSLTMHAAGLVCLVTLPKLQPSSAN